MQAATTEYCTSICFCKIDNTEVLSRHILQVPVHDRCQILCVSCLVTCLAFFTINAFHASTFKSSSPWDSAIIIRSSAYNSSYGAHIGNSSDEASSMMIERIRLRTEPRCTPTPTPNSTLYPSPTLALLLTSLYMD